MMGAIVIVVFMAVMVAFIIIGRKQQKQVDSTAAIFANQHGLAYTPTVDNYLLDENLLNHHYSLKIRDLVESSSRQVFFADCMAKQGNSSRPVNFMILKQPTPSPLRFLLVPYGGEILFATEGLNNVQLEGTDLNKIYKLYAQAGSETDVLTVLAPDTLLWLVQQAPNACIVADNTALYLFVQDTVVGNAAPGTTFSYDYQYAMLNNIADQLTKAWKPLSETFPSVTSGN